MKEFTKMNYQQMEERFDILLETESLEDLLEQYDLAPLEVLLHLWTQGLIQEDYPTPNEESYND